jgi:hypothetical protein
VARRILAGRHRETAVPDRVDPSQHPIQIDVDGHPLVLDRVPLDDTGRFVSPTARIARSNRGSTLLGGVLGLFLVLAIAKPWSEAPGEPRAGPVDIPTAAVAPTPAPTADLSDLRRHCAEPLGWRVYSREAGNVSTLRAWGSVEPRASADGPLDPSIPVVQLGPGIEALGFCSPWTGPERPPSTATVRAWRLLPERRGGDPFVTLSLRSVAPDEPTVLGALFGPLVGPEPAPAPGLGWPAGRYVFVIASPDWQRWWGVDIAEGNLDRVSPSPPPGPTRDPGPNVTPGAPGSP